MPAYPNATLYPGTDLYPAYGGEVAPTVTTGAETGVSYFSATLNGTVDPNGLQTHYWFEYGLTTSYGSHTSEQNIGTGTDPVSVNDLVTGLVDNTTYHYRLVARNGAGTSYGDDGILTTTDALPPTVVTGPVTGITTTNATFGGTVTTYSSDLTTSYYWEYDGSQTAHGAIAGTAVTPVSGTATDLSPGRYYDVRLVAYNGGGFGYGGWITFHTQAEPIRDLLPDAIHFAGRGQ